MSFQQIVPATTRDLLAFIRHELQMEIRHDVGAAGEPAFQNNWANLGAGTDPLNFFIDPLGMVWLFGIITNATAFAMPSLIFTVPAGYAPRGTEQILTWGNTAAITRIVTINAAGAVSLTTGAVGPEASIKFAHAWRSADR